MMTQRERFLALLHNEPTDGFVNQYAALGLLLGDPIAKLNDHPKGQRTTTQWGITYDWPDFEPGPIPMTDDEHVVIKDIEDWQEYVKAPDLGQITDDEWAVQRARHCFGVI